MARPLAGLKIDSPVGNSCLAHIPLEVVLLALGHSLVAHSPVDRKRQAGWELARRNSDLARGVDIAGPDIAGLGAQRLAAFPKLGGGQKTAAHKDCLRMWWVALVQWAVWASQDLALAHIYVRAASARPLP